MDNSSFDHSIREPNKIITDVGNKGMHTSGTHSNKYGMNQDNDLDSIVHPIFKSPDDTSSLYPVNDLTKDQSSLSRYQNLIGGVEDLWSISPRNRRDSSVSSESEALSCGASNCSRMVCVVQNLEAGQHIVVRVQARLWVDTIEKVRMAVVTVVLKMNI